MVIPYGNNRDLNIQFPSSNWKKKLLSSSWPWINCLFWSFRFWSTLNFSGCNDLICDFKVKNEILWGGYSFEMFKKYKTTCSYVYMGIGHCDGASKICQSGSKLENSSLVWVFLLSLLSLIFLKNSDMVYKSFIELP